MRGGNVNEFLDHVTYEEVAVKYRGNKYFFHGLSIDDHRGRRLCTWSAAPYRKIPRRC